MSSVGLRDTVCKASTRFMPHSKSFAPVQRLTSLFLYFKGAKQWFSCSDRCRGCNPLQLGNPKATPIPKSPQRPPVKALRSHLLTPSKEWAYTDSSQDV